MTVTEYAIAEYTPLVLTELLGRRPEWKTLLVESVEASPVGTGQMAQSYRLVLHYGKRPEDAPDTLIAKVSSTDAASRQMAVATGAYQREVLFYERLRELTDIRSPQCFHGEVADDLCGFVLLLEEDRMVPTINSYDLVRRLPNATLKIYPDAGHGGIFQYHEQFVREALEFLGS
jgi:pimeloyl-ACP methyl ester carboxylesterase